MIARFAEPRLATTDKVMDKVGGSGEGGGNGAILPVRSSAAAFYRWIMGFQSSGQSSGGRVSRPVGGDPTAHYKAGV